MLYILVCKEFNSQERNIPLNKNIAYQIPIMLPIPTVEGPKDYTEFRDTLIQMDKILNHSGLESELICRDLEMHSPEEVTQLDIDKRRKMIRCSILKVITGADYRELAVRLAESELLRWFACYNAIGEIKSPSKSTLERFCKNFDAGKIRNTIDSLNVHMSKKENAAKYFDKQELHFDAIFADSTCVKAPIHFPVDWVLLRDSVRSLTLAILRIREQGLKHRMPDPENFISKINSLCISMSHSTGKPDSKKRRKKIFRQMKQLTHIIESHAQRYHCLLSEKWETTQWTQVQAQQVLMRLTNILDKLPQAIDQASKRIIGECKVPTKDKLLSMYEDYVHVIVRGKSGARVEFGNSLYLAEQEDGIIVDYELTKESPPHDSKLVEQSIDRIQKCHGDVLSYTADRGFHSPENSELLENRNIVNGICPKGVTELTRRLEDDEFCILQKRRAQTEARIGIFKNCYINNPLRCKGFENRKQFVALSVLTHNLWKYAVMAREAEYERIKEAA